MIDRTTSKTGNGSSTVDSVFASYIDRLLAGEPIDVDQIQARHPELGDELLEQLRSFCELADGSNFTHPRKLGDFDIIREVGRGGMGVVFEAWQNSLNRPVALKLLPTGLSADSKTITRFMREAQVSGKLNHPHIVPVYGMGVEGHTPYYSMELIDGETLGQKIRRLKDNQDDCALSLRYCFDMASAFAGVADGLHLAHAKTVVHRDIKPSNLMFDWSKRSRDAPDGDLRILDFGLAHLDGQESLTLSGDVVGTVRYMSPEQAIAVQPTRVDHRSDIYSVGASLYEAVTLRPPLEGKDIQDTLSQIATKDPIPPKQVNPSVPRDMETIILKCLRKDRSERYGTAEALAQDLRRFVQGDVIEARPLSTIERLTRKCWQQRRRIVASTAMIVIILLVMVAWWSNKQKRLANYPKVVKAGISKMHSIDPFAYDFVIYELSMYPWGHQPFLGPRENADIDMSTGLEAEALLTQAITDCPDLPDAYWHRCRVRFLLQKDDEACDDLDRVIELSPGHVPALFLKASVQRELGEFQASQKTIAAAENAASHGWRLHWLQAQRAMEAQNREKATKAYAAAIADTVDDEPYFGWSYELRHQLSIALYYTENHRPALRELAIVGHQWPDALNVRVTEATVYYEKGSEEDREFAEKLFAELAEEGLNSTAIAVIACREHTRAVKRGHCEVDDGFMARWIPRIDDPALREVYSGRYDLASDKVADAFAAFQRAIDHRPTDARLHYIQAKKYWDFDTEKAIPPLKEAIRLEPDNVLYQAALSYFLANVGRTAEARELLSKVPHHSHRRKWDGVFVGLALGTLGEIPEANTIFDELSQIHKDILVEQNRGEMLFEAARRSTGELRQQLFTDSINVNQAIISRCPEFVHPHKFKIYALLNLGQHTAAMHAYEDLVNNVRQLSPHDEWWGAKCYREAGESEKAFMLYSQLLKLGYKQEKTTRALTEMLEQRPNLELGNHVEPLVKYLEQALLDPNLADSDGLHQTLHAARHFLGDDRGTDHLDASAATTVGAISP